MIRRMRWLSSSSAVRRASKDEPDGHRRWSSGARAVGLTAMRMAACQTSVKFSSAPSSTGVDTLGELYGKVLSLNSD